MLIYLPNCHSRLAMPKRIHSRDAGCRFKTAFLLPDPKSPGRFGAPRVESMGIFAGSQQNLHINLLARIGYVFPVIISRFGASRPETAEEVPHSQAGANQENGGAECRTILWHVRYK